mmetsp:Transcript_23513/g.26781  ORF Transcript_23513/g.26781 Transcript_23513/m.26781 type:complete len:146 (+) Transcript_23513:131-568(+)
MRGTGSSTKDSRNYDGERNSNSRPVKGAHNNSKFRGPGGSAGGRRSRRNSRDRRSNNNDKPATVEELDAAMDEYWLKSKNNALVSKKLDDEMDSYWEKKGEKKDEIVTTDGAQDTDGGKVVPADEQLDLKDDDPKVLEEDTKLET